MNIGLAKGLADEEYYGGRMGKHVENIYSRLLKMLSYDMSHFDSNVLMIYLDLLNDSLRSRISKEPDLSSEKFFWARLFHERMTKQGYVSREEKKLHFISPSGQAIIQTLNELKKKFNEPLRLVDIGPGPFSEFYIAGLSDRSDLEIVSVDPLADFYRKLHDRYKTNYNIKCVAGYGENLYNYFEKETFHLAYAQNSIDHSQNPVLFVNNMYDLVKPGGYLILDGHIKIGSVDGWTGLHKWDIEVKGNDLLLTNRSKTIFERNLLSGLDVSLVSKVVMQGYFMGLYIFIYVKN